MTEETTKDAWHDVGQQFQALGESLAQAFRAAWEDESTRQHVEGFRTGLESMVHDVGQAIDDFSASPEGERLRQEIDQATESARVAGEKAVRDARPHILSALRRASAELEKAIERLEQEEG